MKKTGIITDSHCAISPDEAKKYGIKVLPMPLYIDDNCSYEGTTISRFKFFEKLKSCQRVRASQASPPEVTDLWKECFAEYETGPFLDIKTILRLHTGLLEQYEKCRGIKKQSVLCLFLNEF